jgi:hypothetical protein
MNHLMTIAVGAIIFVVVVFLVFENLDPDPDLDQLTVVRSNQVVHR